MKNLILLVSISACLAASAQTSSKTKENFMGVEVFKHHTILHESDSIHLPQNAYIIEIIMIKNGDYVVYSDHEPFFNPATEDVRNIIYRNEGSLEMDGHTTEKAFDPLGNEKYADEAV